MKRKYEVEVVREYYQYVEIEVEDGITEFDHAFESSAIDDAMNLFGGIDQWHERRAPYIGMVTDMTGRR